MKMKPRYLVIFLCLCGIFLINVGAVQNVSLESLMGQYFKEAMSQESERAAVSDASLPLAEYHGEKVYQREVEYYNKINNLSAVESQTTEETLAEIMQNIVLYDEATKLGYAATQEEIDAMVANSRNAYETPEGKKMMDQYCEGANITIEEYFDLLEEQAPRVIARQKLLDAVGKKYCEENDLTFTKVNPPAEMVEARDVYVYELLTKAAGEITYYTD